MHARAQAERRDYSVYKAAAAIGLVADALRDPDLSTRTTLRYSPNPNSLQKGRFAERYIRYGRPRDALAWLDGDWESREEERERLLADAYAALEDAERLRALRRALFERTGSPNDFEAWRESLPPSERASAAEVARERAAMHDDPITGAQLLLALDDGAAAEALLLARHAIIRGGDYGRLVPLAQALENKARLLGSTPATVRYCWTFWRGPIPGHIGTRPNISRLCAAWTRMWTTTGRSPSMKRSSRCSEACTAERSVSGIGFVRSKSAGILAY